MRGPIRALLAFATVYAASCDSQPVVDAPPPTLLSVVDRGSSYGTHAFTLYGSFAAPTGACARGYWAAIDPWCNTVEVTCNGGLVVGTVSNDATSSLDVAIAERPSASTCTFQVKTHPGDAAERDSAPVTIGPITSPPIEILSVEDRGASRGAHTLRLHGRFPDAASAYAASVICDGGSPAAATLRDADGALDLAFADPSGSASCAVRIARTADGAATPSWYQRLNGPQAPMNARLGAHHRGGFQAESGSDPIRASVRRIRDAGIVGPIRLVISPAQRGSGWRNVYDVDFSPCPESDPFLPCVASQPVFQHAFDEIGYGPNVAPVLLTVFDSTSGGPEGKAWDCPSSELHCFLDEAWMTAHEDAVRAEYRQLAEVLYRTQGGRGGRTFVLLNWEGDNSIYCGSMYGVTKGTLACPRKPTDTPIASRFAAITRWFFARQRGLADARASLGATYPDVHVLDGIEFNSFGMLKDSGHLDVLHDIIPVVKPAYASYSSWESLGASRFEQDLDALDAYLRPLGVIPVIGEFGQSGVDGAAVSPLPAPASSQWLFRQEMAAALRSPIPYLTIWEPYMSADLSDAVLSTEGVELDSMRLLRAVASAHPATSSSLKLASVTEVPRANGRRLFDLRGLAPGATVVPHVRCDGDTELDAQLEPNATGAVRVSIPDAFPSSDRYCVFYVSSGTEHGADFGPIRSCPSSSCPKYP